MGKNKCVGCHWAPQCLDYVVCEHYTPLSEEEDEEMLINEMESQRTEYRLSWYDYIKEYEG